MHKIGFAIVAAVSAAWGTLPASAQTVEARSPASVQAVLESNGYKPELKKDNSGDPLILLDSQGYKMMVMFFGCKNNVDGRSVSFLAASRAPKKLDLQVINSRNQKRRCGRAMLDSYDDPTLQFDIDLDDGGMRPALFIDNLEWFTVAFDNLKTEVAK